MAKEIATKTKLDTRIAADIAAAMPVANQPAALKAAVAPALAKKAIVIDTEEVQAAVEQAVEGSADVIVAQAAAASTGAAAGGAAAAGMSTTALVVAGVAVAAAASSSSSSSSTPAASTSSTTTTSVAGQTFTLTDAINVVTGTTGNDTFIGDNATATASDQVVGGSGTDTLKLYGNAAEVTHSGVEIIYLNGNTAGFDVSDNADVTELQLDNVATGQTYTIASGQKASVANTAAAAATIDFAGNTVTNLELGLNKAGATGAVTTLDFNSTAQTSLSITTSGTASNVALANTGAKLVTLSVTGDKNLTVDADTNGVLLTTVNASSATGNVSLVLDDATAKDITVTGGAGGDTADFGALFTKADKFDGGAGTDTLALKQASLTTIEAYSDADKATVNTNLSNIEVLKVTDAVTGNINASRYDSVNSFVLAAGFNPAATTTLSKVASGVSVTLQDATGTNTDVLAIEITDATLAGNNSDNVKLILNDAAGGGSVDMGVTNLVGVDILNIESSSTTAAGAAGTTTGYVLDIAATSTALDKLVVTGNIGLDISTVALVNSIAEVDASGMTQSAVTGTGLTVSIATGGTNGVKITGSKGVDVITGGDGADVIDGGTGNDTITGGIGNDQITLGAGNDNVKIDEADGSATASNYDTIFDYSNGTSAGTTDTITYVDGAGAVGIATGMTGWTVTDGVATKTGATLADFITAAAAADTADNVVVFWDGTNSWVYNNGGNDDTDTTDDSLIKLVGVQITSVVTTDTSAANELVIA